MACSALKRAYRDILVQGHSDTRIVYLRGDKCLIANRLKARGDHFMPQALLESQFATLEEPTEDERPIVIDIDAGVDEIADRIVSMLDAGCILS
jgi:carbohydrate kinase (thermoresistant glucokinase family)